MVIVSLATLEARALLTAADAIERGEGRPAREVFDELYASAKD